MRHNILTFLLILLAAVSCKQDIYHTLEVSCNPSEGGSASPSTGSFPEGETVTIKATPSAEYLFEGWSGDVSGSSNPLSIVMDSDKSVVANFVKKTYSLAIEVEGSGHVEERLMGTKSDYESGSIVELTAVPDEYWKFGHWEGDISGCDNPMSIDVTSAKNVKAVFVKPQYSLNVKIVGPGVVDEYLVEAKSGLGAGAQVLLKAVPDKRMFGIFKGWSGSIEGTDPELNVTLDSDMEVIATFGHSGVQFPLPTLAEPSVLQKCFYYGVDLGRHESTPHLSMLTDYNMDGYPDLVTSCTDYSEFSRIPLGFYLGTESGDFIPDTKNNSKFAGLVHCRKILNADFNGDRIPDIAFLGHGYDHEPYSGEYPVLVYGSSEGVFSEHRLTDVVGFFHGGSAGDFDNDGDVDLYLQDNFTRSTMLVNDGMGNFESHPELVNHSIIDHHDLFTADLFDINHDGNLDLFIGGRYSLCIFGDGKSFNTDNYVWLPSFYKEGYESFNDYCFYDIDKDGQEEVLILRATTEDWRGFAIQILRFSDGEFVDSSKDFINDVHNGSSCGDVAVSMNIETIDGRTYLLIRKTTQSEILFEIVNGKLIFEGQDVYMYEKQVLAHGFTIYSDNGGNCGDMNYGHHDRPFSGEYCIKFAGFGFSEVFNDCVNNGTDMSKIVEEGYCLEFSIRNTEPSLSLDFKFSSIDDRDNWSLQTYCYHYDGSEHSCKDEWETIRVPLSEFWDWTDKHKNYWKLIDVLEIQQFSDPYLSFYLDEIRIRKIVDLE